MPESLITFSYTGAENCLNISSFDDVSEIRLLIDFENLRSTLGRWLKFLFIYITVHHWVFGKVCRCCSFNRKWCRKKLHFEYLLLKDHNL